MGRESLGPWAKDDFTPTAKQFNGTGAGNDLPPEVRFRRNVARLVRRRRRQHASTMRSDALAIFLMEAAPPRSPPHRRVPMLDNGRTEVTGRVWFVSPAVISGHYFELIDQSDEDAFAFVTDDLQSGLVPAVVYDPRPQAAEVRFYPNGLADCDACEVLAIADTTVTITAIKAAIDKVFESVFATPDAQIAHGSSVWEKNEQWWVKQHAEAVVQAHLKTGLSLRFLDCNIRHEQTMTAGRVDIEIEEPDPEDRLVVRRPAVIEVKVLRSKNCRGRPTRPGAIHRWIERGVRQVAAYKADRKAEHGVLCCFDMRQTDSGEACFDHVRSLAKAWSVVLARWFLYNTAEAFRSARFGAA